MNTIYQWRTEYRGKRGDVNLLGKELEEIEQEKGSISANEVLERARNENSALHEYFEWDNTVAAEQHRLSQARYLIRMVVVKIERSDQEQITTRAFVELRGEEGPYKSISVVAKDENYRKQLLIQARDDIKALRKKYAILKEVFILLNNVQKELDLLTE